MAGNEYVVSVCNFICAHLLICTNVDIEPRFQVIIFKLSTKAQKFLWNILCYFTCTLMLIFAGCFSQTLLIVLILGFVFGVASAFSPNYYVILLIRGLVGFGFGGGFLG